MQQNVPRGFHLGLCCQLTGTWGKSPGTGSGSIVAHERMGHKGASSVRFGATSSFLTDFSCGVMWGTHWSSLDLGLLIYKIVRT